MVFQESTRVYHNPVIRGLINRNPVVRAGGSGNPVIRTRLFLVGLAQRETTEASINVGIKPLCWLGNDIATWFVDSACAAITMLILVRRKSPKP